MKKVFKKIKDFFSLIFKKIKGFFAWIFHNDKKTKAVKTKKFKSYLLKEKDSNKYKKKQKSWSFKMTGLAIIAVLFAILSFGIIISLSKDSLFKKKMIGTEFLDFDGTKYIAIKNGYIKDVLTISTNSELPEIKDYFIDNYQLNNNATINYYEGQEEVKITDFTYEKNGVKYLKGIRTLDVIINNGSELTTKLAIVDAVPPVVEFQDSTIYASEEVNPESFIKSYSDNSQLESHYTEIIDSVDYSSPGEYTLTIEVRDLSGNTTVNSVKLTVLADANPSTDGSSGGSSSSKSSSGKSSSSSSKSSKSGKSGGSSSGGSSSGGSSSGGSSSEIANPTCHSGSVVKYKIVNNYEDYNTGTPDSSTPTKAWKRSILYTTETYYGVELKSYANFRLLTYSNGATRIESESESIVSYEVNSDYYKATSEDLLDDAVNELKKSSVKTNIQEVLNQSNSLRKANGVGNLKQDSTLNTVAMIRAMEMAYSGYYNHKRPDGSCLGGTKFTSVYKAIASNPKTSYSASENITEAYNANGAMGAWVGSSSHLSAIISSEYNSIGIGMYSFGGKMYWVQIFMS